MGAPSGVNAACGPNGIPKEFRPINTQTGPINTYGQPEVGGEGAREEACRKYEEEQSAQSWYQTIGIGTDENTETLLDGVADSFTSGGNFAYEILEGYKRAFDNPYDPSFDPQKWIKDNADRNNIDEQDLPRFGGTSSEAEANALLADMNERKAAQARMQRMGTAAQFTVKAVAALPDIAIALCSLALLSIPTRSVFRRTSMEKPKRATAGT
ncbi:hypothetical protein [Rhizobium laguerreae]|uniref:hypothetical protein n=1 Tax=Rhizobium laguerreae TaxID=1076926 RepID=UPI001C910AA0|nr:hypothetical protein [Rhizobium laguerreae]